MEEFLNKLYSYEYFGIYLMISILVLIVLFIVILFFGKKDQKHREIEATKKLQQIDNDAFKEENLENKVEVNTLTQENLENDTIIVPSIETISNEANIVEEIPEPVLPVQEEVTNIETNIENENEVSTDINEVETPIVETPTTDPKFDEDLVPMEPITTDVNEITPILEKVEEKPLVFNDLEVTSNEMPEASVNNIEVPVIETTEPEIKIEPEVEEVEVPTFNFEEIMKDIEETKTEEPVKGPEIFSSVYVPEKELTEEPKEEVKESSSEMDFELPTLKKEVQEESKPVEEEKIEMPVLTDYNLDNLSGESYTIK